MARLFVIQRGRTIWQDQGRFEAAVGVPLSAEGAAAVQQAAKQLGGNRISTVYAGETEAERQTAELAGGLLRAKVRVHPGLSEYDYGLWQGLTVSDVRKRHRNIYRQWRADPASVHPPGAETLSEACCRLSGALLEIVKRRAKGERLVVLAPVVMGLLRCLVGRQDLGSLWKHVELGFTWASYDITEEMLRNGRSNGRS